MKKHDYMVVAEDTNEEIFHYIKDARKRAKELSKTHENTRINKWVQLYDDDTELYFDEDFEIRYENGKEKK